MAKKLTSSKAKEILHDKSVHGQPLTDKQRRFFGAVASGYIKAETGGWLDAYNTPQAQNGIEGTMGGLTDKGFNYSPAWGGAWRNGGNLQPPMAGAIQTVPMAQMGGYIYPTTFIPQAQTGDEIKFQEFFKTLPSNLRVDSPDYNLRGYWEALGSPEKFDYSQPKEEDGKYHAFSRNPETGEILKKPWHPTFKKAIEADRRAGYYPIVTPEGKVKTVSGKDFQMGGSLPGATGMMYARTQGAAPSEGPYGKKTVPSAQDGRTLLGTLSNFIPYYETYLDVKDAIMGGLTGDRARMNQGIFGLGSPSFSGKALTSTLDYLTEKGLGKDVADYNEEKRNELINMSQRDRQKLFEKYGAGGYNKWVKAGQPKLEHGGEMQFYQHGLDWTPRNISENGSVVKDDMGYWNPDNWGRIVEIDSPYITMQGVNQDLIGVSDTGDVQYMTPGNDYTFDGESVTEYPVAKNGVNQQDEKTVQHLDQLLNFTNKPKAKNGWLDKYK